MKKRVLILLTIVFIILISFLLVIFIKYISENTNKPEVNISDNSVLEVIDGDTFKLGNGEIVRLICVDAPEKGKKGYEEAKEFLESLVLDKEVSLEKDVSDKDEYNRLLRYVYVNSSLNNDEEVIEVFVNKEVVQQGYAKVFRYGNDTSKCGEIESE